LSRDDHQTAILTLFKTQLYLQQTVLDIETLLETLMRSNRIAKIITSFASVGLLGCAATAVQAQDVGRVVSLTPNVRQVQIPKQVCGVDAYRNQTCTNQIVTQNVNDGFNVVYEFDGRLFTMFSVNDPGPYVYLNVAPQQYAPTAGYVQPPVYSSGYAPTYGYSGFPATYAPVIVRPYGYGYGYAPRPVVVVRGGGYYGGYRGEYGHGHHGGGYGHRR
jgi:hypothetical protein